MKLGQDGGKCSDMMVLISPMNMERSLELRDNKTKKNKVS